MGVVANRLHGVEPPPGRRVYTVRETAALLGVSADSVYEAIKRGELRAIRVGARWAIPMAWLDRLLSGEEEV